MGVVEMKRSIIIPLWTLILVVVLLAPIVETGSPTLGWIKQFDKVVHFCLFTVTGFVGVFGTGFLRKFRSRMFFGIAFGLLLAAGTEFAQYSIPARDMSFYDLLADVIGLGIGLLVYALLHNRYGGRPSEHH